jgi:hypothetical protein
MPCTTARRLSNFMRAKTIIVTVVFLLLGYEYVRIFMMGTIWGPLPNEPEVYSMVGSDTKSLIYAFMPSYKLIGIYSEGNNNGCY